MNYDIYDSIPEILKNSKKKNDEFSRNLNP